MGILVPNVSVDRILAVPDVVVESFLVLNMIEQRGCGRTVSRGRAANVLNSQGIGIEAPCKLIVFCICKRCPQLGLVGIDIYTVVGGAASGGAGGVVVAEAAARSAIG